MVYRVELSPRALHDLARIPDEIKWKLADVLAEIGLDPRDPLLSEPTEDPDLRWTMFADGSGFVEFGIWDDLVLVLVLDVAWIG